MLLVRAESCVDSLGWFVDNKRKIDEQNFAVRMIDVLGGVRSYLPLGRVWVYSGQSFNEKRSWFATGVH